MQLLVELFGEEVVGVAMPLVATSSWWMVFAESSIGCRMRRRALMNLNKENQKLAKGDKTQQKYKPVVDLKEREISLRSNRPLLVFSWIWMLAKQNTKD